MNRTKESKRIFLMEYTSWINNLRVRSTARRPLIHPWNLKPLGNIYDAMPEQVEEAIQTASNAFPSWSQVPGATRRSWI